MGKRRGLQSNLLSQGERAGRSAFEMMHPGDIAATRASFDECLRRPGVPVRGAFRLRHKDGGWRHLESIGVNRLEARAVGGNGRGNGVLHKLGARPEANLARGFRKDGRAERQLLWSLREEDWRQRPLLQARFSSTQANEQILRAIEETRRATPQGPARESAAHGDDYSFFITGDG